jgi:NIMA (never in mitosis gene a)-related kinase
VPFKAEDMEGLMKTILTGKYDPIPNIYSKELAQFITQMLQLKPKNRPNCDKMLKNPILLKKIM